MNYLKLVIAIVVCEVLGAVGTIFTVPNIPTWYASLAKPFFSPPNWVFGPVWTLLFLLMGIAVYLVWEKKEKLFAKKRKVALVLFGVQFFFNLLWSFLFFGLRSPFLGFVGILALWISIVATMWAFLRVDRRAALLLVPYLLWVSFATILNFAILLSNP